MESTVCESVAIKYKKEALFFSASFLHSLNLCKYYILLLYYVIGTVYTVPARRRTGEEERPVVGSRFYR